MPNQRSVQIFIAGCPVCRQAVELVQRMACESCEVDVLDLNEDAVAQRAADLGIRSVPAVVIDGELAACCEESGISEKMLREAGIGRPLA